MQGSKIRIGPRPTVLQELTAKVEMSEKEFAKAGYFQFSYRRIMGYLTTPPIKSPRLPPSLGLLG